MAGSLHCGVLPVLAGTEQDKIASDNLCTIFLFSALPVLPTRGLQLAQKSGLARIPIDIQGKSTTMWLWIAWIQHLRLCLIQLGGR
jgi:hypothetical protein